MKLLFGAVAALLLAWVGLKNPIYNILMTRDAVQIPVALDYTVAESWASQPMETPPGAWETPWGVDVFLIYPAPRMASPHGLMDADEAFAHVSQAELKAELFAALPTDVSVYAPKYRAPSNTGASEASSDATQLAGDDISAAFQTYLATENRWRSVMLVTLGDTEETIAPLLQRLQAEDFQQRFAGLVHFTPNADATIPRFEGLACSPALEGNCYQWVEVETARPIGDHLLPRLPNTRAQYAILDPEGTAAAIAAQHAQVSVWLDANGPKPAEPLFGFEAIEAAPIYKADGDQLGPDTSGD